MNIGFCYFERLTWMKKNLRNEPVGRVFIDLVVGRDVDRRQQIPRTDSLRKDFPLALLKLQSSSVSSLLSSPLPHLLSIRRLFIPSPFLQQVSQFLQNSVLLCTPCTR